MPSLASVSPASVDVLNNFKVLKQRQFMSAVGTLTNPKVKNSGAIVRAHRAICEGLTFMPKDRADAMIHKIRYHNMLQSEIAKHAGRG